MDHYKDGFDPARFLQQMDEIPAFLTDIPDDTGELPPLVAALQSLKYEEDDPDLCAANYKEDGNVNFKLKKFKWAIECYDKALQQKSTKPDLLAAVYFNRAAANFHLKNYRRTIKDSCEVLKIDPLHIKACLKGIVSSGNSRFGRRRKTGASTSHLSGPKIYLDHFLLRCMGL
jgi:tetratricopeptide (TPR) repeat protein